MQAEKRNAPGEAGAQAEPGSSPDDHQYTTSRTAGQVDLAAVLAGEAPEEAAEGQAPADDLLAQIKAEIGPLSDADYEARRREIGKRYRVRASWLDGIRYGMRPPAEKPGAGKRITLPEDPPWPQPVDTAELLGEIVERIRRHVVLSLSAAVACTLYVFLTFCVPSLALCPLLIIGSPEMRCGKTLLLSILARLAFRALTSSSVSAAAIYRIIEAARPTLVLDEVDATLGQKTDASEAIRGVINAGHTRAASLVLRCEKDSLDVVAYDCFGPKILAGIGRKPGTLMDRAVRIELTRKLPAEKVERLSALEGAEEYAAIRSRLTRWAADHAEGVGRARPSTPEELDDRSRDNWSGLLAIADLAGREWPARARAAAFELSGPGAEVEPNRGVELLRDLFTIFERARERGTDRLATSQIIEELVAFEEAPWSSWGRNDDKPITPRGVASLLKPFGVHSSDLRGVDGAHSRQKGYKAESFSDAWGRFIRAGAPDAEKSHETEGFDRRGSGAERGTVARQEEAGADISLIRATAAPEQNGLFPEESGGISVGWRAGAALSGGVGEENIDLAALSAEELHAAALRLVDVIDGTPPRPDLLPALERLQAAMSAREGGST